MSDRHTRGPERPAAALLAAGVLAAATVSASTINFSDPYAWLYLTSLAAFTAATLTAAADLWRLGRHRDRP